MGRCRSADNARLNVKRRLVQTPTLVSAVAARLQVDRGIVRRRFALNIEATLTLHVTYFQIDAELGHGPLLARLTRNAFSLNNRVAIAKFFVRNLKTQIAVHGRNSVITSSVARYMELLVITRIRAITIECL